MYVTQEILSTKVTQKFLKRDAAGGSSWPLGQANY